MDIGVVILTCNAVFFYSFLLGVVAGIKAAKGGLVSDSIGDPKTSS